MNCRHCGYDILLDTTWESGWAHHFEGAYYYFCDNPVASSGRPRVARADLINPLRYADIEFEQTKLI